MPTGYCKATGLNPFKGKKRGPLSEERKKMISENSKGRTPWNKGKVGYRKHSDDTRLKMKQSHARGENHKNWKGSKVKYVSVHSWIHRNFGKAKDHECRECGGIQNLQWANLDGKYSRNIETWAVLCRKCHYHYDKNVLGVKTGYNKFGLFEYNGKIKTLAAWAKEIGVTTWTIYDRVNRRKIPFIKAITMKLYEKCRYV